MAEGGVVVGRVQVPLSATSIEFIAHELEHILERAEGVDLPRESERTGSGVWRAVDGFETQRATDMGRQVAREVGESLRAGADRSAKRIETRKMQAARCSSWWGAAWPRHARLKSGTTSAALCAG